ncbi:hypothetical protein RRG08_020321 [Elysia crispata]|uniref:Uncharacterized protein n=1 Tax=Elysia crispata TaxID=231223 RepID=A0AAE0YBF3_9GAST|nr:hypothetical protein RRG08_020321 [Elysia crispata]
MNPLPNHQKSPFKINPLPDHQKSPVKINPLSGSRVCIASFPSQKSPFKINPLPDHQKVQDQSLYLIRKCMYGCVISPNRGHRSRSTVLPDHQKSPFKINPLPDHQKSPFKINPLPDHQKSPVKINPLSDQSHRSRLTVYLIKVTGQDQSSNRSVSVCIASFLNQKSPVKINPLPDQSHESRSTLYLISKCMYCVIPQPKVSGQDQSSNRSVSVCIASFLNQKTPVKINPLTDQSHRSRSTLYLISKCMYCVIPQAEVTGQDQSSNRSEVYVIPQPKVTGQGTETSFIG